MADSDQIAALVTFLRRSVADGTKTLADLKALSLEAFGKMSSGVTVIEVGFEGGTTRSTVNCAPHLVMTACEQVIAELDPANEVGGVSPMNHFADFSGGRIET